MERAANAVADAVKRVEAADNARDNAVQEAAELQRAVAESGPRPAGATPSRRAWARRRARGLA